LWRRTSPPNRITRSFGPKPSSTRAARGRSARIEHGLVLDVAHGQAARGRNGCPGLCCA
jgi:hypothetical protein